MFETTKNILEKTESIILVLPTDNKLWSLFTRYIVFPFKYLRLGFNDFLKPISVYAFIAFALIIASGWLIKSLEIPPEYKFIISNCCLYFPMVIVIFAVPSTYAYYGITSKSINKITKLIEDSGINSPETIELLEKNIEKINSRISTRIVFYQWVIGSFWAIYTIIFNIEIRQSLAEKTIAQNPLAFKTLLNFALILVSTMGAFILVIAYKRASEYLIKSIEFSCIELKFKLLNEK